MKTTIPRLGILIASVAALSLLGASPAMANGSTALCGVNEDPCPAESQLTSTHFVNAPGTVVLMQNSAIPVLCLNALRAVDVLGLGKPQSLHTTTFTFSGCGTNAAHSNCTVSVQEPPLSNLLHLEGDMGVVTEQSGTLRLACPVFGDCVYNLAGVEFEVVGGEEGAILAAYDQPASLEHGIGSCPLKLAAMLDFLLITLEEAHISS